MAARSKPYERPVQKRESSQGLLGSIWSRVNFWQQNDGEEVPTMPSSTMPPSNAQQPQPAVNANSVARLNVRGTTPRSTLNISFETSTASLFSRAGFNRSPSLSTLALRSPSPSTRRALPGSSLLSSSPAKRRLDQLSPEQPAYRTHVSPFKHVRASPGAASTTSSVQSSARKRQMVWSPTRGFVAVQDHAARAEGSVRSMPMNEAEKILNTLESMRSPSKEVSRPVRLL
jgi:hypothetical protein